MKKEDFASFMFMLGYGLGLFTVLLLVILGGFSERGSNMGVVTEMSTDYVKIDGSLKIKTPPTKNLMIGDTVNFYTN